MKSYKLRNVIVSEELIKLVPEVLDLNYDQKVGVLYNLVLIKTNKTLDEFYHNLNGPVITRYEECGELNGETIYKRIQKYFINGKELSESEWAKQVLLK